MLQPGWQETYFQTNGVRLHAVTAGQPGHPLALLLHGFPENWYSWRHQIPLLARAGYYVVAPDMRGYKLSQKPRPVADYSMPKLVGDVKGLVEQCGAGRATLIAHDWGAAIAWTFAMQYPHLLRKLVICNVPHPAKMIQGLRTVRQLRKSWYIFAVQIPWLPEWLLTRDVRRTAWLFFRQTSVRKEAFTNADLDVYANAFRQPGAMRSMINYYRNLLSLMPDSLHPPLITTPTLMLWGEEDIALGKELTYGTAKYVKDLRIHYIPHCGHWVQQEAAAEVNHQISAFLGPAPCE